MPAAPAFQIALGAAVKARREELELTQEQLALRSELHQRWISNVETGKRNPSYASLRRLAAALDLTTSELIARAEQTEASGSTNPGHAQTTAAASSR
jgi:transcriptional regulator with XRE-family HTH domain